MLVKVQLKLPENIICWFYFYGTLGIGVQLKINAAIVILYLHSILLCRIQNDSGRVFRDYTQYFSSPTFLVANVDVMNNAS